MPGYFSRNLSFWRCSGTYEKNCRCRSQSRWLAGFHSFQRESSMWASGLCGSLSQKVRYSSTVWRWEEGMASQQLKGETNCCSYPLVTNSNFIMWLMQQDSDFTRTSVTEEHTLLPAACAFLPTTSACLGEVRKWHPSCLLSPGCSTTCTVLTLL